MDQLHTAIIQKTNRHEKQYYWVCQVKCVNFFVFLWWPGNPATFSM